MTVNTEAHDRVLDVPCPRCFSDIDEPCQTVVLGQPTYMPHQARVRASVEALGGTWWANSNPSPSTTNNKENNTMNSNTRAKALDQLALEAATERLRPIHADVLALVDKVKINQAILATWESDGAENAAFYFRRREDIWEGPSGEDASTDIVVRSLVRRIDEHDAIVRRMKAVK